MNDKFTTKVSRILPPTVILPLLMSYMLEHIGISIYWIFFGLELFDTVSDSYFNIALVFAIPAMLSVFGTTFFSHLTDKTKKHKLILFLSRVALMIQFILLLFFNNNIWIVLI
ncbi:MAG: MFS transporter, partial [Asgard group archaeon]|nr:MFS transporter [Asgard group archaeon]